MSRRLLTITEIQGIFRRLVERHGGNCAKASRAIGISNGYLSDIINERKQPGDAALSAIGFETAPPLYRRVKK